MPFKPLVIDQGQIKQLPSGESVDVGGWALPPSGGTEDQLLQADAGGNAQWVNLPDTWDWPDPLGANMVLVSTGVGTVGWESRPFGYNLAPPTAVEQILQATAVGTAGWRSNLEYTYAPVNDSGEHGIKIFYEPSVTLDGAYNYRGLAMVAAPHVSSGTTNSSYTVGAWISVFGQSGSLLGTLDTLTGIACNYGIYSGSGSVGDATGLSIAPYHTSGTIDTSRALWIQPATSGAVVNTEWAIYCQMLASSYFAGGIGIGSMNAPSANGDKVLWFGDNAADPTMGSSTAGIFAKQDIGGTGYVEMYAVNSNGDVSRMSNGNILDDDLDVKTYKIYTSTPGGDIVIEPNGTGALRRTSDGNARGDYAVDWQCLRADLADVASGYCSVIAGGEDNTATSTHTVVSGGLANMASGNYSTVGGGYGNEATDHYATIGGGYNNDATGDYNTVGGGRGNLAQGISYNTIGGGQINVLTGSWSTVAGGYNNSTAYNYVAMGGGHSNTATEHYAVIPGGVGASAIHWAEFAHSCGSFENVGDAQRMVNQLRAKTTSTAQTKLYSDGAAEILHLLYGHTWYYTIKTLAVKKNSTQNAYAKKIEGIITRATGGTQHVAGPTVVRTLGTSLGTVTVDDPDHELRIQVTPNTTDEVWWLAVVDMVQINGYVAP